MPLRFESRGECLEATLSGTVTTVEIRQLQEKLVAGVEADIVNLQEVGEFPAGKEVALVALGAKSFPVKRVAFVCTSLMSIGYARMMASLWGLTGFNICSTAEEACRWLKCI